MSLLNRHQTIWGLALLGAAVAPAADLDIAAYPTSGVLRQNLPATLFNGHVVHHKAAVNHVIWDCRSTGNTLTAGYSANAFTQAALYGVRYPGGTAADDWYDYNDQGGLNWLAQQGVTDTTHPLDTVDDILGWCRDASLRAYFIVPVKRFWPVSYGQAVNYAVNAVALTQARAAALNAPMPEYWDIGNEVYEPDYDSTNYAAFAGRMAEAMRGQSTFVKPVVCVKRGNGAAMDEIVAKLQSTATWWDNVKGVTMHVLNTGEPAWRSETLYDQTRTMITKFPGKTPMVTALAPGDTDGLICADAFLGSYRQLIRAGIQHIVVWPVTHFNNSGRQYVNGALTPSGQVLRWLALDAVGGSMIQSTLSVADETNVLTIKKSANEVVMYIAGNSGAIGKALKLTVEGFTNATVTGQRMTAASGDTTSDTVVLQNANPAGTNPYYISINKVSQYEILRLVFTK
jgi:hypothetical protein